MTLPLQRISRSVVLALAIVVAACGGPPRDAGHIAPPALDAAGYCQIASRLYLNEALGESRYLTHWGAGEDFPSFGIGHFIWFPAGVDAPFDESFPSMFDYVRRKAPAELQPPAWLIELAPFAAPWTDKAQFDASLASENMTALREWLSATGTLQARYVVDSFVSRWNALDLPPEVKQPAAVSLQRLLASPEGLYAVIDYYNFKGLGTNPRERYAGEGWGLVQVLGDIADTADDDGAAIVGRFAGAAAARLQTRVRLAPPERNEARWLAGWLRRVRDYASGLAQPGSGYIVTPYVQDVGADRASFLWFSRCPSAGRLVVKSVQDASAAPRNVESRPQAAEALHFDAAEPGHALYAGAEDLPYRHEVTVDGLSAAERYTYEVVQDNDRASSEFRTSGGIDSALRFVVYADSETEPESTGERVLWAPAGSDDAERRYLVDQTTGYAANIDVMRARHPDFVAIAGDLVESGGEQRDWDEFWRHNAALAASTPIYPAPGNHEYYGGPGALGAYTRAGAERAIGKYRSYFAVPDAGAGARDEALYYATRQGPATLIVIDPNDGVPERSADDTNWYLSADEDGSVAPAWQPGSPQHAWLRKTLAAAQRDSPLTFVMFHAAPYSSGIHNRPPGLGDGQNFASGLPLRSLVPLFLRYGVDAVFNGHDEQYEHSVVHGAEQRSDGSRLDYALHFFVVGIGGDGLRGPEPDVQNPARVFLAHDDAPETVDEDGVLTAGGKHYGHLEVNVERLPDGRWHTRFEPVYVLPVAREGGHAFERRVYDDVTDIYTGLAAGSETR